MAAITQLSHLNELAASLHQEKKQIVLAGGCFDILHAGHVQFLTAAKEQGDRLIILLESDVTIRNTKGVNRPIHTLTDRTIVLAALAAVDVVIPLLRPLTNDEYDELVITLKPAIIATTAGDPHIAHKKRQALLTHARVVTVMKRMNIHSSSDVAAKIAQDL